MYCIGLTGSIASGKSTVAARFAELGIDVISADDIAKALVNPNQPALQQIINYFGKSVLTENAELNRRRLRELIINSTTHRLWLENLLHPLIREKIQHAIELCKSPYCIIEIPLLTDISHYPYLNRILLVLADPEQQIIRMMSRDHCSEEHARALLLTTRSDEDNRRSLADDLVVNDGSIEALHNQVDSLNALYLRKAE